MPVPADRVSGTLASYHCPDRERIDEHLARLAEKIAGATASRALIVRRDIDHLLDRRLDLEKAAV